MDSKRMTKHFRGLFMGGGSACLSLMEVCSEVLTMVKKPVADLRVVYLGTASHDVEDMENWQTDRFKDLGCSVQPLKLGGDDVPDDKEIEQVLHDADVIIISGGNTLWAIDRWRKLKVDQYLRDACMRGTVLCGGSFGAVCWFDSCHSDCADPTGFREYRLKKAELKKTGTTDSDLPSAEDLGPWEYIRCECLGFLPGLLVPHFDSTIADGTARAQDAQELMIERAPTERAICIDNFAGLKIENGEFEVISVKGRPGTSRNGEFCTDKEGTVPAVWIVDVVNGETKFSQVPQHGKLADILKEPTKLVADERCDLVRKKNP